MIGFTPLYRMLARFKVFFLARIDLTRPEYCRKLIVTLYVACINTTIVVCEIVDEFNAIFKT